jgi:hypothetical protein
MYIERVSALSFSEFEVAENRCVGKLAFAHRNLGHSGSQHSREIFEIISQREVPRTSNSKACGGSTTSPLGRISYLKALLPRGPLL